MLARLKKVPKRLFLLIYIDDIYILFLRMPLDKVLENIALTHTTRTSKDNDIALSDPGINLVSVVSSGYNLQSAALKTKPDTSDVPGLTGHL